MPETFADYSTRTKTDPLTAIKSYADYYRTELAKTGQLTEEENQNISVDAYKQAIDSGLVIQPADETEADYEFKNFLAKPVSADLINIAAREIDESGKPEDASKLRAYAALQSGKIKNQYVDQDAYAQALSDAKAAADPILDSGALNNAKRFAVKSGLAKVAVVDENGKKRVELADGVDALSDEELATYANAFPQYVDPSDIPAVKHAVTKITGTDLTPAKLQRKDDLRAMLVAHAQQDDYFAGVLESAKNGFVKDAKSTAQSVTDTGLAILATPVVGVAEAIAALTGKETPHKAMPVTAEEAARALDTLPAFKNYSQSEIKDTIADMAASAGINEVEYDDKNPASVARVLSNGEIVMPVRTLANKAVFDKVLAALPVADIQKQAATAARKAQLDAYAKELLPQLIQADGNILDEYTTFKAAGKTDGEALEAVAANHQYGGAINRLENFGLAVGNTLASLLPVAGIISGNEQFKDAMYSISNHVNNEMAANKALAGFMGKDFGWTQQLVEQVPQLAADILISRGAGKLANAVGKGTGKLVTRTAALLEPATAAKLSRFYAASKPSLISKEVAEQLAKRVSALPNEIGWLTSQGARTFGSTYTSVRSSLEAQTNEDGSQKFSKDDIDKIATQTAVTNALISNAVTFGFNRIAGGKLAGSEVLMSGKGFSTRELKKYYDDVVTGIRSLPKELKAELEPTLTTFADFTKGVVTSALQPIKNIAFGAMGEAGEEFVQTVTEDVLTAAATNSDLDLSKTAQNAALAASFGAALGGGSTAISEAETKYLREPAYQKADFEEAYLKKTVEKLRAANSPATADFLEQQLKAAQNKKQSIRERFASINVVIDDGTVAAVEPVEVEQPITRLSELNRQKANLESLITRAEPVATNPEKLKLLESLKTRLATIDKSIANYDPAALAARPLQRDFPIASLPAVPDPENYITVTGPAIERDNGQFEMPFMADWLNLQSRSPEEISHDEDTAKAVADATAEFDLSDPAANPNPATPVERAVTDLKSVSLTALQAFKKRASKEDAQLLEQAANALAETHVRLDALAALDVSQTRSIESIANAAKEEAALQEERADLVEYVKSIVAKPVIEHEHVLNDIFNIANSVQAVAAEIVKRKPESRAKAAAAAVDKIVEQIVVAASATANPAETIAEAVEKFKPLFLQDSKFEPLFLQDAPAKFEPLELQDADAPTKFKPLYLQDQKFDPLYLQDEQAKFAPLELQDQKFAPLELQDSKFNPLYLQDQPDVVKVTQAMANAMFAPLEEAIETGRTRKRAQFSPADVSPLVSDEKTTYRDTGGEKQTGMYLKDFDSPDGFLTTDDYETFHAYLAKGTFPTIVTKQNGLLAYGSPAYVKPFFNTLKREIDKRYPVNAAPKLDIEKNVTKEQVANERMPVMIYKSASGLNDLHLRRSSLSAELEWMNSPNGAVRGPAYIKAFHKTLAELETKQKALEKQTAKSLDEFRQLSAELIPIEGWLRSTRPLAADELNAAQQVWREDADIVIESAQAIREAMDVLVASDPKLAEVAELDKKIDYMRNHKPLAAGQHAKKMSSIAERLDQLDNKIADYAKYGDIVIEQRMTAEELTNRQLVTYLRKKKAGENAIENVQLALHRVDGKLTGFHTNDPQRTADLLDRTYSVFVPVEQRTTLNPAIRLDASGYVDHVVLSDGRVVSSTGDLRAKLTTAYEAEENDSDYQKLAYAYPPINRKWSFLISETGKSFGDSRFIEAASAYLNGAKNPILRDLRERMLATGTLYDDFVNAALTKYLRTIREYSLAATVKVAANNGEDITKVMARALLTNGELAPEVRKHLIKTFGQASDRQLITVYGEQLAASFSDTLDFERSDEALHKEIQAGEFKVESGFSWKSGRPPSIQTIANQVAANFGKALSRRETVYRNELPDESVSRVPLTQAQMDDVANIEPVLASNFIDGGNNNKHFEVEAEPEANEDFKVTRSEAANALTMQKLVDRTVAALDDPAVRFAFDQMAHAYGIANPNVYSNKEMVELFRNEHAVLVKNAQAETEKLIAAEVERLRLAKQEATGKEAVAGSRMMEDARQTVIAQQRAKANETSRRVVSNHVSTLAQFAKEVADMAEDIRLEAALKEAKKARRDRTGKSVPSQETRDLFTGKTTYKPSATVEPLIVPSTLASNNEEEHKAALIKQARDAQSIRMPDGKTFTRETLATVRDKMVESSKDVAKYGEAARDRYKRLAAVLSKKLRTRKKEFTVGVDIPTVFESIAITNQNVERTLRENNLQIAQLDLTSSTFIQALSRVNDRLKPVAQLLLTKSDILRNVRVEIVTLPNTSWAGMYSPESNTVFINKAASNGRGVSDVLVHELIHAVTHYSIRNPQSFSAKMLVGKLESLRTKAYAAALKANNNDPQLLAGLSNLEEFVSYMFTSADFQKKLDQLDGRSFFRKITDAVIAFFTGSTTSQAKRTLDDMIALVGHSTARPYGTKLSESIAQNTQFNDLVTIIKPVDAEAELIDVVYDSTVDKAVSTRVGSDSVYINPDKLAELTAEMSESDAVSLTRQLINHELAHITALKALSDAELDVLANSLSAVDKYGVAGEGRELASNYLREQADRALSGFTSAEYESLYRRKPELLQKYTRYLQAYQARLTSRIGSAADSQTAASVNRVSRVLNSLTGYNEVSSFEDGARKAAAENATVFFSIAADAVENTKADYERSWLKKLFVSELRPELKDAKDERDHKASEIAHIAVRYDKLMRGFMKAGKITQDDFAVINQALGGEVHITKDVRKKLNDTYDKAVAAAETAFESSTQTEADKLVHDKAIFDAGVVYDTALTDEYKKADREVRKQQATAQASLDPVVLKEVLAMREEIDKESARLARDPHLSDELKAKIDSQSGLYITRTFRSFNVTGWFDLVKAGQDNVKVGNEIINFAKIKEDALAFFAERAEERLTKKHSKDKSLTDTVIKARVARELQATTEQIFADFIARYDSEQNGLLVLNTDSDSVYKALLAGTAAEPAVMVHKADSLKYGQKKYTARKNLPEEIKALLGEVNDPIESGIRTLTTVSLLAANQKMLTDMAEAGLDAGYMTRDPVEADARGWKKLSNGSSDTVVGLDGLYGSLELKQTFAHMFERSQQDRLDAAEQAVTDSVSFLRNAAGKAMAAKTLLSVGYYSRNFLSDALFFGPMQGILFNPFNVQRILVARTAAFNSGKADDAVEAYVQKLIRIGVLDNDANITALRQSIGGFINDPVATAKQLRDGTFKLDDENAFVKTASTANNLAKSGLDRAAKLSNVIANNLKIAVFEHELEVLTEAHKNDESWTQELLEKEAARKVSLTTQTRSQVVPLVKKFTESGIGSLIAPFLVFKSEVFRTTANTFILAKEEMKSGNAVIASRGRKRLAGSIFTLTAMPTLLAGVLQLVFGAAFGEDDDKPVLSKEALADFFAPRSIEEIKRDKALRAGLPEWQQNNGVRFAVTGHNVRTLDLTFIVPQALFTDPFMRSFEHIVNGDSEKITETFTKWAGQQVVGEQIAAGAVVEALNNRDSRQLKIVDETLPYHEQLFGKLAYVFKQAYMPPVVNLATNVATGTKGSKLPDTAEHRMSNRLELLLGEALGARPKSATVELHLETAMRRANNKLRDVRSAAAVANSDYHVDAGKIRETYERQNDARVQRAQQVNMLLREFGEYMEVGRMLSIGREAGISKDSLLKAKAGYAERYEMPKADLRTVFEKRQKVDGAGQEALKEAVEAQRSFPKYIPVAQ